MRLSGTSSLRPEQWASAHLAGLPALRSLQVRPLMKVASVAAPTAIVEVLGTAVLLFNNVLHVESRGGGGVSGEVAVLTPIVCQLADQLAKGPCHQASLERLRRARALACKIAMKSMVWT